MTGVEQTEKQAAADLLEGVARSKYQKLGKGQVKRPVRDEPVEPDAASAGALDTGGEIDLTGDPDDGDDSSDNSDEDKESGASRDEESGASGDESQQGEVDDDEELVETETPGLAMGAGRPTTPSTGSDLLTLSQSIPQPAYLDLPALNPREPYSPVLPQPLGGLVGPGDIPTLTGELDLTLSQSHV